MRQKLWILYQNYVKCKYYYQLYEEQSIIIERIIGISAAIVSSASVASWFIWSKFAVLWSILIALSNILHIIKPFLPYERRISAINYMLPELNNLINEVEYFYNSIQIKSIDDIKINETYKEFQQKYTDLENKFIFSVNLPRNDELSKEAEKIYQEELAQKIKN